MGLPLAVLICAVCVQLALQGFAPPSLAQGGNQDRSMSSSDKKDDSIPTIDLNLRQKYILPKGEPIELGADKLTVDRTNKIFTARGNVTVSQGNSRIRADTVQYDRDSHTLRAEGNVIVRSGNDVLEGERFRIRLDQATGVLYNGKLLLTRHNVYLSGKKLEKTGDSTYKIEKGSFTTCDGPSPDWRITGRELDVTLDGYGVLRDGFFYIKDIPVFYLPWMIYPAKQTRQTGFLVPSISNSSVRGFDFRLPFFWNISPSVDATITPRLCTKRAAQASTELRYVPTHDVNGRFYGEYTYDWHYGPEIYPRSHRFYVTWRHHQNFLDLLKLKINGNWVSDRHYFEFWGGKFEKRRRVRYLESNAVVYRQWDNFLFQAEARHFLDLDVPDNAVTVQNLPTVTATIFNQNLPYTPFYFSSNLAYDNFFAPLSRNRWLGSRIKADTRLSLPISLGRFLKLEPAMTYYPRAYMADYYVKDKGIKSETGVRADQYQIDAMAFTDLYTVFRGSFFGFERVKHIFRPKFAWTYRPDTNDEFSPYFDESDRHEPVSLLTAEFRNTLTGRLGPKDYLDFMDFTISQGFDFNSKGSDKDMEIGGITLPLAYGWTNTRARLTFKPHTLVDLSAQTEYDPIHNRARQYSVDMGLMDHRGDLVRVLHQFIEDERAADLNRQTNVSLQVKLTPELDCFFENQYTHQYDFSYFTSVGLAYHPQCWNVVLRYSESRSKDQATGKIKDPDQTVFMTLSLFGLGQIYEMTRAWTDFLGAGARDSLGGARGR